jgi:hypothetical protein
MKKKNLVLRSQVVQWNSLLQFCRATQHKGFAALIKCKCKKFLIQYLIKQAGEGEESQDLLMDKNEHYSGVVFCPGIHSFPSPAELVKKHRFGGIVLVPRISISSLCFFID